MSYCHSVKAYFPSIVTMILPYLLHLVQTAVLIISPLIFFHDYLQLASELNLPYLAVYYPDYTFHV